MIQNTNTQAETSEAVKGSLKDPRELHLHNER